jgi:small subunit ribosomal protein S16
MAVIIRLRRDGAKNSPYYRIVVADKHSPRDGKFLELIGTYDPKKKGDNSTIKLERADHWMKLGARPSDTVRSMLKKAKAKVAKAEKEEAAARKRRSPQPPNLRTRAHP